MKELEFYNIRGVWEEGRDPQAIAYPSSRERDMSALVYVTESLLGQLSPISSSLIGRVQATNPEEAMGKFMKRHGLGVSLGFVYFVEAKGANRIKIGWSQDPNARIKQLQTSSPFELKLLGFTPGSKRDEKALHERFSSARISKSSEWFRATKEVKGFIFDEIRNS